MQTKDDAEDEVIEGRRVTGILTAGAIVQAYRDAVQALAGPISLGP